MCRNMSNSHADRHHWLLDASLKLFSSVTTPFTVFSFLAAVPEAKRILAAFSLRHGAQRKHRTQHPQQLQGHAHLHDQLPPEECGRGLVQLEDRVRPTRKEGRLEAAIVCCSAKAEKMRGGGGGEEKEEEEFGAVWEGSQQGSIPAFRWHPEPRIAVRPVFA